MKIDIMLVEGLISFSNAQRRLELWLISFQVCVQTVCLTFEERLIPIPYLCVIEFSMKCSMYLPLKVLFIFKPGSYTIGFLALLFVY